MPTLQKKIETELFNEHLTQFREALERGGAMLMPPRHTNEGLRFRSANATGIAQIGNHDITLNPEAFKAWTAYLEGVHYCAGFKLPRPKRGYTDKLNALYERDAQTCFYCLEPVDRAEASVEHVVPKSLGGGDHMANLVLAHVTCNHRAGSMSLKEKIALRESYVIKQITALL